MNVSGLSNSIRLLKEPIACPQCGSTSRVGRGLCLNCLLQTGLGAETGNNETLESVLAEIDVPDADWRIGNYQILEEIGRGGMGVIYRARQRHSRRIVALKRVLSYHADSRETLARFRREAEAAASLDHPNILPIYEVSEDEDGLPFFSMKFAPGGSLLDAGPALRNEPRRSVALMAKVARAVQYAHVHGILHRDLKPGNILLDGRGEPLVSDFGLAKWLDATSDVTRTLTIFGTPGYIAPEQARGPAAQLKPAADVYSLGAILFDLFTGRPPFLGEHALAVIQQAAEKPAPKLRTLASALDRDLETICARCLEREPSARYHSAGELAEDLERWLEGRSIIARPVSPTTRVYRWSRRNPVLASAAAACALLGVLAVGELLSSERLGMIVRGEAAAARSVGMLPFEDLDEVAIDSEPAHGFTEKLRAELSRAADIGLTQTPDQMRDRLDIWKQQEWHDLGSELGVRNLLSGTIRTHNGKKRVSVQLVDAVSGATLKRWIQEGDSEGDIAAIVAKSATAVVHARANHQTLASTANEIPDIDLVAATNKPIAKDYYVAALELRSRLNIGDFDRAITLFEKAVEADPNYGAAYAMLASACQARSELDPAGPWLEKGNAAAEVAIRLAPRLAEAQRAYAGTFRYRGQLKEAFDAYLSAFELDQTSDRAAATVGNAVAPLGRPDLALRWYDKAVHREPRPGIYSEYIGDAWSELGEDARAKAAFRNAAEFRPDLSGASIGLARLALLHGEFENARKQCQDAQSRFPGDWELQLLTAETEFYARRFDTAERLYRELAVKQRTGDPTFSGAIRFLSALGFVRRSVKDESHGKALLEEARTLDRKDLQVAPDNPRLLYSLAADYAALGETDPALRALQNAVAVGWIDYRSLSLDPRFDSVRETQEFKDIFLHLTNKVKAMDASSAGRTAANSSL
jgi:tetratricopeptide (TPR) repeat protein/TolB-like protein/tRNA A-37 threonylcarbamoyl transferase component Bud32